MKPEKLNLWDRFFNRYRYILVQKFTERYWRDFERDMTSIGVDYPAGWIRVNYGVFRKIDRLTGSETEVTKVI